MVHYSHTMDRICLVFPWIEYNSSTVTYPLVRWRVDKTQPVLSFECRGFQSTCNPIKTNIEELILQKLKGSHIVVWSKGGADWAESVVIGLGLEKYVDAIMTKPDVVYDDLPVEQWITKRINMEENDDGSFRA